MYVIGRIVKDAILLRTCYLLERRANRDGNSSTNRAKRRMVGKVYNAKKYESKTSELLHLRLT